MLLLMIIIVLVSNSHISVNSEYLPRPIIDIESVFKCAISIVTRTNNVSKLEDIPLTEQRKILKLVYDDSPGRKVNAALLYIDSNLKPDIIQYDLKLSNELFVHLQCQKAISKKRGKKTKASFLRMGNLEKHTHHKAAALKIDDHYHGSPKNLNYAEVGGIVVLTVSSFCLFVALMVLAIFYIKTTHRGRKALDQKNKVYHQQKRAQYRNGKTLSKEKKKTIKDLMKKPLKRSKEEEDTEICTGSTIRHTNSSNFPASSDSTLFSIPSIESSGNKIRPTGDGQMPMKRAIKPNKLDQ